MAQQSIYLMAGQCLPARFSLSRKLRFSGRKVNGNWDFFTKGIETSKGLILIPENGINIYLQKKSFSNQSNIIDILRKIENHSF